MSDVVRIASIAFHSPEPGATQLLVTDTEGRVFDFGGAVYADDLAWRQVGEATDDRREWGLQVTLVMSHAPQPSDQHRSHAKAAPVDAAAIAMVESDDREMLDAISKRYALFAEIERVVNRHSQDAAMNTPDYVIAEFLTDTLETARVLIEQRDAWYGFKPHLSNPEPAAPADEQRERPTGGSDS